MVEFDGKLTQKDGPGDKWTGNVPTYAITIEKAGTADEVIKNMDDQAIAAVKQQFGLKWTATPEKTTISREYKITDSAQASLSTEFGAGAPEDEQKDQEALEAEAAAQEAERQRLAGEKAAADAKAEEEGKGKPPVRRRGKGKDK
jgi:hypothetical protein